MSQISSLLQTVFENSTFRKARAAVSEGDRFMTLAGLTPPAKAILTSVLAHETRRPLIVLTSENETADRLAETAATTLSWLEPDASGGVSVLPAWDTSPYEGRSPHAEIAERRAVTLWKVARGLVRILFAPLPAALARFREISFYSSLATEVKLGDDLILDDLTAHLSALGYEPTEPVEDVGQYSVRGGIFDVFPAEADWPLRIEFFGDRVESVRHFDPSTQRSRGPAGTTLLLPLAEWKRSPEFFRALVSALGARLAQIEKSKKEPEWPARYSGPFPGWMFFAPLVEPHPNSLATLTRQPIIVWDEMTERKEQMRKTLEVWAASYEDLRDTIPPRPRPEEIFFTEAEFLESVEAAQQIDLKELFLEPMDSTEASGNPPSAVGCLRTQPAPKFHGDVKAMISEVRARLAEGDTVAFVLPTVGKADRLREILSEYEVPFESAESPPRDDAIAAPAARGRAVVARGAISDGTVFPDSHLALFTDGDLFGSFDWGIRRRERFGISSFISSLGDLKPGEYVVHVDHGIGIYRGLRQILVEGAQRDFMLVTYHDEAKLYVPLERLDLVEKYRSSGDGAKPQLDRLGGATWERTKKRVKRALRDMAQELLRLYAERKMHGGVATSADSPWQKEFEDAFPFEETPDQLAALTDIKRDLESPAAMDRLLCGDVGYGKTELAMRAALKVAQDARQVAVLAPTTVLAFQHYETFRARMAPFPVRVEMLSRFRAARDQKNILAEAESGKVDILIGTHRLLSKDVTFRELGLLIVDEEQRFGVAAKEKLKKLKTGVDVLTMSATPIPRTLHMSLGGLRDLSVIETPPRGRLAIQTTVAPFSHALIQASILQEMERQGQVFFVHNRVESIFSLAALVQRLVPTARIGVAHGQLKERELERVMLKFMQGELDVLAATALIENGLDIPRANTIIVNHADRFGLADLYQLRGRVGRSNRRAYAYFLVPDEASLSPMAKQRLAALREFSDLGAGFRLAALDLELRGAGNVLGREQHGQLNAIGIDLYLKMLEETVEELQGAPARPEVHTTLNLGLDIKIPDRYIADESARLKMYKRISSLATLEARAALEAELTDRYGPIPQSVSNLLGYALLKSAAEQLLIHSLERKGEEIWVRFDEQAPLEPQKLSQFVRRHREARLRPDGVLHFRLADRRNPVLEEIQNSLQELRAEH